MQISLSHQAGRELRLDSPALQASLALLNTGTQGKAQLLNESADVCATLLFSTPAATLNSQLLTIAINTPIEGLMMNAGPITDAVIMDGSGNEWATVSVSDIAGNGELKLVSVNPPLGAYVRLVNAVIQG